MKDALRWTAIAALFAIPFLPLYISYDLFFPFITGKNFAFRALVAVALAAYVALAFMDRRYRPRFSWLLAAFGVFVGWMAVANALGVHPMKAFWSNYERMDGWVMLIHLFALFIVAGSVLTVEKLWRKWWYAYVGVATLVCGYGLLQLSGAADIHQGSTRLTASLGNAIYLAVYLMFAMFAAAWLSVKARGSWRYALWAFIPLAFIVFFFTGSRGPLVGLGAGAVLASVIWLFLERKAWLGGKASRMHLMVGGALAALALVAGGLFLVRENEEVRAHPILARAVSVFSLEEELRVRGTIWGMALKGVAEDPLTGWGQEGFNQVFNKYYEPSLYAQEQWFDRVHNLYLDWMIAGGVPAFLLFVALLALAAYALLCAPDLTRAERAILLGALAAYAVQALVVFDNLFSYVPFVLILAYAHASHARAIPALERQPEIRDETTQNALAAGALIAGLAIAWLVNAPGIAGAHHLLYGISPAPQLPQNLAYLERALSDGSFATQEIREQIALFAAQAASKENYSEEDRAALAMLAIEEMEKEIALSPNDARLRVQYANALKLVGDLDGALREQEFAIALSPRKQTLILTRAFTLYEAGRIEEARETFAEAYALGPEFETLARSVATGYIVTGDVEGGKAILVETFGTTTPNDESLFYAYYQAKAWDELISVAQARVTEEQGSAASRYRLAQAYAAAGRLEAARLEISATMAAYPGTRAQGEALMAQIFQSTR